MMTWASFAARTLSLVLVLPLVLRSFSAEQITVWYLLSSLVALQFLIDLGFTSTFTRIVAYAMGGAKELSAFMAGTATPSTSGPNWPLLTAIYSCMRTIYARLGWALLLVLGLGGTAALLRPVGRLDDPLSGWISWGVVLVTTVVSFRANVYAAFLQGTNHVALTRRWEAMFSIASILCSFVTLLLNGGLLALVVVHQIWMVLTAFRNYRLAGVVMEGRYRNIPPARMQPEVVAVVWPAAWRSAVASLMSFGLIHLSGIVAGQHKDSVQAASYLLGLRLMQMVNSIAQAPFYSKLPAFGQMFARGENARLVQSVSRSMRLAHWSFVIPFAVGGLAGPKMLALIHSQTPFPSSLLWGLLGAAFLIERYGAMHIQLFSLTNKILSHVANGVSGGLALGIAWYLYPRLGMPALPLAMAIGYALFYAWYCPVLSYRAFGLRFPAFEFRTMLPPAVVFVCVLFLLC